VIRIDSIVLYHRTNKKNVDNILKKGLLLSKATSLKCVYLSKHKDTNFGNALFQVTVNNDRYPKCYDLSDWEVVCFHDIIPDDLKILEV